MISAQSNTLYDKAKNADSIIKFLGAPNNSTPGEEIDMEDIDANATETFTLEEFRSIVIDCRQKNIDFILARVTTPDPYEQSNLYNFYYAASEINRALFRFESDRRLLHRMKVRNPLNNMVILGQVYYYKITTDEVDRCLLEYFFNNREEDKRKSNLKSFSEIFRSSTLDHMETDSHSRDANDSVLSSSNSEHNSTYTNAKEMLGSCDSAPGVQQEELNNKKVVYRAKYFATDDDFLIHSEVRDYFKRNTLDKDDDFLFEIDRGQNDFFALLESGSEEDNEEVLSWKRILTAHVSLLISLLGACFLIGNGLLIIFIAIPLAVFFFLSFISSIFYILFCRRNTFDTLSVQSVEQV